MKRVLRLKLKPTIYVCVQKSILEGEDQIHLDTKAMSNMKDPDDLM
jgi:hypothetical protein